MNIQRKLHILLFIFFQFNCIFFNLNRLYSRHEEKESQKNHSACMYYAEGELYPSNTFLTISSASLDILLGLGIANIDPVSGGAYLFLGFLTHGERIKPYNSKIWCGNPDDPTFAPLNYYYVFDSYSYYSCYESPCKILEGCQLDSARRKRIVSNFLHYNELDYCTGKECLAYDEYTKETNSYIFKNNPIVPESNRILIIEKKLKDRCIYAFHFEGGIDGAKRYINNYKKTADN